MNILRKALQISLYLYAITALCGFTTAPDIIFVSNNYSGHEEISRQAINNTIKRFQSYGLDSLTSLPDFSADLIATPRGLFGSNSKNMIIHGNFASDFPNQTKVLSLAAFWKIPTLSNFENPNGQVQHFLRNYKNSTTLVSANATCLEARENIKHVTEVAMNFWEAGDKTKALFLFGHVTHTIQDSFSAAHTIRESAQNNYNLKNICFYGNVMGKNIEHNPRMQNEICFHDDSANSDIIWNLNATDQKTAEKEWADEKSIQCDRSTNYPQTEEQKQNCLKHEARLARVATEKFLYIVLAHINSFTKKTTKEFVDSLETRLFDGPVGDPELDKKMPSGIMRCEGLSNQEIYGYEPIGY
ncbi:MAG: hypothetical protein WA160_02800 [Pseudobdellovibrio sp.]